MNICKLRKIYVAGLLLLFILFPACNDEWNAHYDAGSSVPGENLWQIIRTHSELSVFTEMIKISGYDEQLSSSQAYTVFAPVNDALRNIDLTDTATVKKIVGNHIAKYSTPVSGLSESRLSMLNGKYVLFQSLSTDAFFGGMKIVERNIAASNGILHSIENIAPYQENIWQFIGQSKDVELLKNYLYSFNERVFMPSLSKILDMTADGKTVYDSVFINTNRMFYTLGYLNDESYTYTTILPTNTAWNEAYGRIKEYYKYNNKIEGDSLQKMYTNTAIVRNLSFAGIHENPELSDSLVTSWGNVFYNPGYLFEGAIKTSASNGLIYTTDLLKYKTDSWHAPIIVEAENYVGRDNTVSAVYTRTIYQSKVGVISDNRYIEVIPNNSSARPTVTFSIPGTLSAKYNIYCVFLPGNVADESNVNEKTKVNFTLFYIQDSGKSGSQTFNPVNNETSPTEITKMLVAENFKFPFANYGEKTVTVSLRVSNTVASTETTVYNRNMRIDCIILEPADVQP